MIDIEAEKSELEQALRRAGANENSKDLSALL
jgi:hypothetical protein